ncbi:MAG: hypothetical protein ACJA04_001132 [Cellvibrionaceae bacterium]|jgi:uncharacterized protein (DUF2237 family)
MNPSNKVISVAKNVFGEPLELCCNDPITGYFRDGYCNTGSQDQGKHLVCAVMTHQFLEFSYQKGNDLITARPEFDFPGLQAGDSWCVCAMRWLEAHQEDAAPSVKLLSTHEKVLTIVSLDILKPYAIDVN